jgi:hypothetical protein
MNMQFIASSAIRAIGYDVSTMRLRIVFTSGRSYDFCRVPPQVYHGLMKAGSKGSYYNNFIRDRYHC